MIYCSVLPWCLILFCWLCFSYGASTDLLHGSVGTEVGLMLGARKCSERRWLGDCFSTSRLWRGCLRAQSGASLLISFGREECLGCGSYVRWRELKMICFSTTKPMNQFMWGNGKWEQTAQLSLHSGCPYVNIGFAGNLCWFWGALPLG